MAQTRACKQNIQSTVAWIPFNVLENELALVESKGHPKKILLCLVEQDSTNQMNE
jgi:hypothetical protein